jgi:TonB-dependent receptor
MLVFAAAPAFGQAQPGQNQASGEAPAGEMPAQATAADAQAGPMSAPTPSAGTDPAADAAAPDIVVTGFRQSLASSRNLKRTAPQFVDAVVAEDIGKLPDLAVSDTAARIPGVQVIRLGGEASQVLIRGLPEAFFNTLYNGREIFTAERRQVSLQDFPSAGIAALEVYKTSTADQVDPGVVGLTNVRSRRPFDIKGFEIAGNVWGLHTAEAGKVTPNGNILISNRWDTNFGEIGVLLNASYTKLDYLDSEISNTDFIADPIINGQHVRLPDIQRVFYRSGRRERPSGNAAFQWRPNDTLEFYVEGLYQGFRNQVNDTQAEVPLYGGQSYSNIVLRPGTNLVSSGTVVNPGGGIFSFRGGTFNKTDTYQIAGGGTYHSGGLRITADVARSRSTFTGSTESVDRRFGVNGYTVDFNNDRPQFAISGFNVADPAQYQFVGLFEEAQKSRGDDWQARVDAEYKFDNGLLRSIQLGGRYTTRDAHRNYGSRYFGGQTVPVTSAPIDEVPVQPGFKGTDTQPFRTYLAPSYQSIRDNIGALRQYVIGLGATNYTLADAAPDPVASYDAREKTYAGYAQLNYNFNDTVDGSVGVRVVRAETTVNGNTNVEGVVTPANGAQAATDYLPNASLRWHITPQLQFRFSYTKTRTRPDFSQINPSLTLGSPDPNNQNLRTGTRGNPGLRPFRSDNYDASLEWYFSPTGFASAAVFRRDLNGFFQTVVNRFNDPTLGFVEITQTVNSGQGRIDGIEAQLSTFLDFDVLPTFLHSFGIQANYTYLDAGTQFVNQGQSNALTFGALQGVSRHSYNIVGLFERGPISARLTYNGRSSFLDYRQYRPEEATGYYNQYGHPPGRLDLSTNVRFTPAATLFFDATNLLAQPFRYSFTSARGGASAAEYVRLLRFEERTFSVGLRFRFGA